MKQICSLLLTAVMTLGGCAQAEPDLKELDQVILLDVQGLWGGQDLWISTNGQAVCRFVAPPEKGESGLQETRYEFALSEEQRSTLPELIKKYPFFSIRTEDRYGVPDEARPCIYAKSGVKSHAVGKWANDKHRDFDSIYEFLLKIVESGKKGKQIHRGVFDWNWKPDGFPDNKCIWDMTRPKIKEK
jgi:hypothetical protein